ncbi:Ig-like domain-containing protein [Hymenobacter elongatus]|uniref:T9SS type A sorting domain-containing protein n=1 Tax=Hymenobacter elongatus TaxID=877208 RepID=A0A4Z0PFJ2_9BACT|nr:Ig-like domain-containing protein [Hymenobacter elongatus]TGE12811.1 T9SS type A sorting domain-containing protein [Hymenobacter elongatus]
MNPLFLPGPYRGAQLAAGNQARRRAAGRAYPGWLLALLLLLATTGRAQTAATKIYWVQGSATPADDRYSSSNLDGTGQATLASGNSATTFFQPNSLWVDAATNVAYVGDGAVAGSTGISRFNASTGAFLSTIVAGGSTFAFSGVQVAGTKIYWVQGSNTAADDRLCSANLDGTGQATLASGNSATTFANPNALWVDAASGVIYVGDGGNAGNTGISRFSLTGTYLSTIVAGISGISINGIQVVGSKIYWVQSSATASDDQLNSANLDGTGKVTLASGNSATTFFNPQALLVDVPNSTIFVGDGASSTSSTGISRFSLTGTYLNTIVAGGLQNINAFGSNSLPAVAPTVTTAAATSITPTSAVLGGNVTADGGATISDRGVVYVVGTGTPTTSNTKVQNGTGTGSFSQSVTGLAASTQYTVRAYAINSAGTSYGSSITFTTPATLSTTGSQTNVSCFGGTNGSATVSVSGGTTPYTYSWNTTPVQTTATATGLSAGTYTVTVTDASSATITRSFTITQPTSAVTGTTVVTNVSCNGGSNGAINLTPSGGTSPYTFRWNSGATTEDRTGLSAGTYSVTITDVNGCTGTVNTTVTQPASALTLTKASQTNIACFGGNTGAASVNAATGGTAPYTYDWTPGNPVGDGTRSVTGLTAQTYTVTVTDANGCTATQSFTLTQPASALATTGSQTNVTTNGGSNGTATVSVSGGTPSYTYSWSPSGGTSATASGLSAGTYTVTVTDANGCTTTRSFTITQPAPVTAAPVVTSPPHVSLTNDNTPTYAGTAPANATVNVFVDGTSIGTTTATAGGTFALTQPTALPDGTHTVNATATAAGLATSGSSNTNGFTVDATAPTVAITSSTGTSGSTTSTSPIAFTITFSENVSGFVAGDVTVSNGSVSGFAGSGTTYTFNVTPTANGAVTVNVPANVAQDAAGNGNTAATQFSITYSQLVTAAPVVNTPANGSLLTTTTPTYAGTAPASSTVTVFIDGSASGTTTATASGSFSLTQPTALSQGSHTVRATAQTSGSAVSADSNTNTFTIDTVRPTVAITSTASNPTNTSPIPVTVTFSEAVTGFVAGDVTVSNGSITGGLINGSGTTYSFNVTPAANGLVTVNVPANVVQDAAGNGNTAASPFSINYTVPTTTVTSIVRNDASPTNAATVSYTVTFSASVSGLSASNFTLSTSTAMGASVTSVSGAGTTYTVVVSTGFSDGTLGLNLNNSTGVSPTVSNVPFNGPLYTIDKTVPAAPVVTEPANGSVTRSTQPILRGTAEANTTVTVVVDGTAVGTTPADLGGNWAIGQPTALANGSHTVAARTTDAAGNTSPNSSTNTFTVDTVSPTVAISSTASNPTNTSPIPVRVTFSEIVTGFTAGDVTVSNGTLSAFSGFGGTYTFNVTPTAAGTVTVNIAANVATDEAGNSNTAAPQFAIQYTVPVTATSWTGTSSTDWFAGSNWTAGVPTSTLDATIPAGMLRYPVLTTGPAAAKNLALASTASLTQSGGTLDLKGNFSNDGTFTATGGLVSLSGSANQTIGGGSRTSFWDLTVGPAGATLGGTTDMQRVLTLNGNLTTSNNLFTLLSSGTATAMVVNTPGSVVGTATVPRYISPSLNNGLGYRHYSSPVVSTTVADLTTTGFAPVVNADYNTQGNTVNPFPTVYGFDESRIVGTSATTQDFDYGYFSPTSLGSTLLRGRGYTVNINASEKVDLVGTLNSGTVPVGALTRGNQANSGWQLLGNPYPSPLDWKQARLGLPTGVLDAVYVYKSSDVYAGTYQFYQNGFGTLPNGIIGSMQGFFLRVSQPVASFNFLNSWRSTTYEAASFDRPAADTRPALQLDLVSAQGPRDPAYVYFEEGATPGVDDHYDAEKLPNTTGLNLASVAAGTGLAINGLPFLQATTLVPLTVGVPVTGTYTLQAASLANFGTAAVYLLDAVTGQQIDLKQQTTYSFSASNAALITGRFSLSFGALRPLATSSSALAAGVALYPNPASKMAWVELPAALGRKPVTATLLDALGRVVRTQQLPANGNKAHALSLAELPVGVYSLRLSTEAGLVTKRLIIE